jgi:capsular exopolysaccharide synthesis family protein
VELREYVRACRRRWVWIVVPMLLAAGIAAGLSLTAAPAYRSSMVLFVTTGSGDPDAKASRLNSYIALLTGPRVAESVVAKLGGPLTATEVQQSLSAQVQEGTDLLVVSATDPSAARSRTIVTTATSVLVGLAKQLDPPTAVADGPKPSVTIAQNAVTTREPGNMVRDIGFSAVLGLLIGAVAVAVREATRKTVGEEDDLRRLGLAAVGVISLGGRSGRTGHPDEALAEAFRRLRSLLPDVAGVRRDDGRGTSLMLTGPNAKEGTTAVACGLAIAMAETGARVVLVDGNLRSPGIGRFLSVDASPGLAEVLAGTAAVPDALQDSLDGRLTVLPSGEHPPDPGAILASPELGATIRTLTERFDFVLVDAPPVQGVADAAVLSKVTDGALLVVRANRTRTADVERSMDLLERVGARLAGAVLNALPRTLPTGTAWHRDNAVAAAPDNAELVTHLLGDDGGTPGHDAAPGPADRDGGTVVARARLGTARGRARVVESTVGKAEDVGAAAEVRAPGDAGFAVRGQARVVVAQPASAVRPEPPNLPVQRAAGDKPRAAAGPAAAGAAERATPADKNSIDKNAIDKNAIDKNAIDKDAIAKDPAEGHDRPAADDGPAERKERERGE